MPNYRNNGGGGGGGRRGGGGGGGGGGGRGNYHQPRTTRVDVTLQRESQYISPNGNQYSETRTLQASARVPQSEARLILQDPSRVLTNDNTQFKQLRYN
uniref:Inhibitor of growth protein 1 homolog n=1 Tax=Dermatophagoides pteronyssinus TaxID=6956 RepID=A0A6P6XPC2_DERPT|nr:inhibitor of growth protein 1 homolog [Dermatophagoides pteronyssinus]